MQKGTECQHENSSRQGHREHSDQFWWFGCFFLVLGACLFFFSQKESIWQTVRRLFTCGQTLEGYLQTFPFFPPALHSRPSMPGPQQKSRMVSATVRRQKAQQTSRAKHYLRKRRLVSKPVAHSSTFKPLLLAKEGASLSLRSPLILAPGAVPILAQTHLWQLHSDQIWETV